MIGAAIRVAIVTGWVVLIAIHATGGAGSSDAGPAGHAIGAQAGRQARYEAVWRGATVSVLVQEIDGSDGRIAIRQRMTLTGPLPMLPVDGPLGEVSVVQELDHGLRLIGLRLDGTLLGEPVSGTAAIDHRGLRGAGSWAGHRVALADPDLRPEALAGCGMVAALPPGLVAGQRFGMPILAPRLGPDGLSLERRTVAIQVDAIVDGRIHARAEGDAPSEMTCLTDGTLLLQRWPQVGLTLHLVRLTADDGTRIETGP